MNEIKYEATPQKIQYTKLQSNKTKYDTIQYNKKQKNTMKYNSIQYKEIL